MELEEGLGVSSSVQWRERDKVGQVTIYRSDPAPFLQYEHSDLFSSFKGSFHYSPVLAICHSLIILHSYIGLSTRKAKGLRYDGV